MVRLRSERKLGNPLRSMLPVLAIVVLLGGAGDSRASQVLIVPDTTGTFSWDWIGGPRNEGWGFGDQAPLTVGAYQKQTFTRNYRSYLIFDTASVDSAIVSATLDLNVTWRTTVTMTNPASSLEITLGLPKSFTAQEIADPFSSSTEPASSLIYADLATNAMATSSIPFGDVFQVSQPSDIPLSIDLPFSFVAAFNQARLSSRYLTVSVFGGDYGFYSAGLSVDAQLKVNTLSPVPEPISMVSLALGIGTVGAYAHRRKDRKRP